MPYRRIAMNTTLTDVQAIRIADLEQAMRGIQERAAYCLNHSAGYYSTVRAIQERATLALAE
jgi:hypothetical protein